MPQLVSKVMKGENPGVDPVNPDRYPIFLDNDKLCRTDDGGDENIFLLYVIKSRMESFESRNTIRRTWGQEYAVPGVICRRIFLLGIKQNDPKLQQRIAQEHNDHQDIVQGYFLDRYFNNTIKLIMGFRWATTRCKSAKFISFFDDDYFVSPYNLVKYLHTIPDSETENFIVGYTWRYAVPFRYKSSKWYLSLEEYPYRFFPPYPAAGSFIVSQKTAHKLSIAFNYIKFMKFDDVFVGIATWKLHIPVLNNDHFHFYESQVRNLHKHHRTMLAAHGFKDYNKMQKFWEEHDAFKTKMVSYLVLCMFLFSL